ncbi:aldo/keto reductase [Clostridium sp. CF012]|uniref:aldo/keto reductase n=1 Tax=Clostridium sp. CF012 TaxID=2843319 RepID=UPI001C0E13EE|nr:aldo/keto reductase [Clostridium sp. CF012]MBU3142324.1 aldo/keto reductase [Clostridium sp. CF012]
MSISKLTLGTVQMGLDYGINNKLGKIQMEECHKILDFAYENGILSFDTAKAYGNSETIIGDWIKSRNPKGIFVSTKISSINKNNVHADKLEQFIKREIEDSLKKLNITSIDNIYLHDCADIQLYNVKLMYILRELKEKKVIKNIGISVYEPKEVIEVLDYGFDIIQIPTNVFDLRFITSDLLKKMKSYDIQIFSRSAFLQGLFFMNEDDVPNSIAECKKYLKLLKNLCKRQNITAETLALGFLKNIKEIDSILIGVNSLEQLESNLNSYRSPTEIVNEDIIKCFNNVSDKIIDPRKW